MTSASSAAPGKLFGRYHEVMLLVFGTLCGTVLGTYLQHLSWTYQHDENLRQAERLSAERIAGDVSRMIDTRLYRMRRVLWACRRPAAAERTQRWTAYELCLDTWNSSLNGTLVSLDRYFGSRVREDFERQVHAGVRWIGERMEELRGFPATPGGEADSLLAELDRLNAAAYEFNGRLLDAVRLGEVGQFLPAE
jgi:hypothetical protein